MAVIFVLMSAEITSGQVAVMQKTSMNHSGNFNSVIRDTQVKTNRKMSKNIFGEALKPCSNDPLTGFYRDGCCKTGPRDMGTHTVCAIMTAEFLEFSRSKGNDLITPVPAWQFPGLKPGDKWCLCASRWMEAYHAGLAPLIIPEATHEKTLEYISLKELIKFAYK